MCFLPVSARDNEIARNDWSELLSEFPKVTHLVRGVLEIQILTLNSRFYSSVHSPRVLPAQQSAPAALSALDSDGCIEFFGCKQQRLHLDIQAKKERTRRIWAVYWITRKAEDGWLLLRKGDSLEQKQAMRQQMGIGWCKLPMFTSGNFLHSANKILGLWKPPLLSQHPFPPYSLLKEPWFHSPFWKVTLSLVQR